MSRGVSPIKNSEFEPHRHKCRIYGSNEPDGENNLRPHQEAMSPRAIKMNHLVWLFYGKEPLFGGLVPGAGRRCICNPAALFLSRAAGKLRSRCFCQAEGALPHRWLFWAVRCRIGERSMGCAAGRWRLEEWMWSASLRWVIWSERDNSCIPGKFMRFWTFFPILCHTMKKFWLFLFCKGISKKKSGTILMLCLNAFETYCFEFYLTVISLISLPYGSCKKAENWT